MKQINLCSDSGIKSNLLSYRHGSQEKENKAHNHTRTSALSSNKKPTPSAINLSAGTGAAVAPSHQKPYSKASKFTLGLTGMNEKQQFNSSAIDSLLLSQRSTKNST